MSTSTSNNPHAEKATLRLAEMATEMVNEIISAYSSSYVANRLKKLNEIHAAAAALGSEVGKTMIPFSADEVKETEAKLESFICLRMREEVIATIQPLIEAHKVYHQYKFEGAPAE